MNVLQRIVLLLTFRSEFRDSLVGQRRGEKIVANVEKVSGHHWRGLVLATSCLEFPNI